MSGPDEARPFASSFVVRWLAAVLCLEIAAMHVIYQGGFALRHPGYVGVAHVILEVAAVVAAIAVVTSAAPAWWLSWPRGSGDCRPAGR